MDGSPDARLSADCLTKADFGVPVLACDAGHQSVQHNSRSVRRLMRASADVCTGLSDSVNSLIARL